VAILIKLIFGGLDLSESGDWVEDDVVGGVKLTFLNRQKLAHNRRQTVEVVAIKALLLVKELDLVQGEVFLDEGRIDTDFNVINIFLAAVVHTG